MSAMIPGGSSAATPRNPPRLMLDVAGLRARLHAEAARLERLCSSTDASWITITRGRAEGLREALSTLNELSGADTLDPESTEAWRVELRERALVLENLRSTTPEEAQSDGRSSGLTLATAFIVENQHPEKTS